MPSKKRTRIKVVDAPEAFTDEELRRYEYWLALFLAGEWLFKAPRIKCVKKLLSSFGELYSKMKQAMQKCVKGKVRVNLGKSPTSGKKLVIPGEWFKTSDEEAEFALSLFRGYLAGYSVECAEEKGRKEQEKRIVELEEEIERRDMRIRDLENALEKERAVRRKIQRKK